MRPRHDGTIEKGVGGCRNEPFADGLGSAANLDGVIVCGQSDLPCNVLASGGRIGWFESQENCAMSDRVIVK